MRSDTGTGIREQILAAAEQVIHDKGLAAATTRAIAQRAGCAEGSIYRYFPDKHALFIEVAIGQFPEFIQVLHGLGERVGARTVAENLEEVAGVALKFYRTVLPMVGGAMSEHKLLYEQRRYFREHNRGPMKAFHHLADYLRAEQELGRISMDVSADHATRLLLGTCFAQSLLRELVGDDAALGTDDLFAHEVVRTLIEGLACERAAS